MDFLARLVGQEMPGGCDDCDAYQEITQETPGVFLLRVHHDDTCPWYLQHTGRGAA